MDSLEDSYWDLVIEGTGIQQSLLALALSRSGKKVLHVDEKNYYGGPDAALTLQDAEDWVTTVQKVNDATRHKYPFSNASITQPSKDGSSDERPGLADSRRYSLALSPQLIYAQSKILSSLVSSRVDNQLEFVAMGSWWLLLDDDNISQDKNDQQSLIRIPNVREDLLGDSILDAKTKRALIKFLRFVIDYENQREIWNDAADQSLADFLTIRFGLSPTAQQSLNALSMAPASISTTTVAYALPRISQHLKSIGVFGPGFGAVIPKYGGLAEIAQVGCRACAVGGGVYMLGNGIKDIKNDADLAVMGGFTDPKRALRIELEDGEHLSTQWLVRNEKVVETYGAANEEYSRSVSIISSPLSKLVPYLGDDGGQRPAGAVIVVAPKLKEDSINVEPPVYIVLHSSDTGDCPRDQCILYCSIALSPSDGGFDLLDRAVHQLLHKVPEIPEVPSIKPSKPKVLWRLQYAQHSNFRTHIDAESRKEELRIISFPAPSLDLVFEDRMLQRVEDAWRSIMETESESESFLIFPPRRDEVED